MNRPATAFEMLYPNSRFWSSREVNWNAPEAVIRGWCSYTGECQLSGDDLAGRNTRFVSATVSHCRRAADIPTPAKQAHLIG